MDKIKIGARFIVFLTIASAMLSMLSCKGAAKEAVQDGDFKVEFLFEKDGCKMYRFKDGGRYIYWSSSAGRVQKDVYHTTGKSSYVDHTESISN